MKLFLPLYRRLMVPLFAATALLGTLPVQAEVEPYDTVFDFWVGYFSPGPDSIDGDLSYGLRGGYNISRRYTIGGELSWAGTEGFFMDTLSTVEFDYDVINVDFITDINFAGKRSSSYAITLGVGRTFVSTSGTFTDPDIVRVFNNLREDSWAMLIGAAAKIQVGAAFYFRPAVRWRYVFERDNEQVDAEYLLAFGWQWD